MKHEERIKLLSEAQGAKSMLRHFSSEKNKMIGYVDNRKDVRHFYNMQLSTTAQTLFDAACEAQTKHLRETYLAACVAAEIEPEE